jgi:hypothetical protein
MPIKYEWDIETVAADEDEDILDHDHRDKLSEFGVEELIFAIAQQPGPDSKGDTFLRLVLVRDRLDDGGVVCRSWAYVTDDGKMPEQFLDAYERPVAKVPKRFIEEFNR